MDNNILTFVDEICNILDVDEPNISSDCANFKTSTMLAQYVSDTRTIYINTNNMNLDLYFAIAHELRHVWQLSNYEDHYFNDYKTADQLQNVNAYNLQKAEIDANAFGLLIMSSYFEREPLFNGLSDDVKKRIKKRADQIYNSKIGLHV